MKNYLQSKRFKKLKAEYLKNDDEYIKAKRKLAKEWLTEESAEELLKYIRDRK